LNAALVRERSAATEPTFQKPCTIALHFSGFIFKMFRRLDQLNQPGRRFARPSVPDASRFARDDLAD